MKQMNHGNVVHITIQWDGGGGPRVVVESWSGGPRSASVVLCWRVVCLSVIKICNRLNV